MRISYAIKLSPLGGDVQFKLTPNPEPGVTRICIGDIRIGNEVAVFFHNNHLLF
jgi:hypothetical protein